MSIFPPSTPILFHSGTTNCLTSGVYNKYFAQPIKICENQHTINTLGFAGGSDGKESACNMEDLGSIPGLRREQQPTPVF